MAVCLISKRLFLVIGYSSSLMQKDFAFAHMSYNFGESVYDLYI